MVDEPKPIEPTELIETLIKDDLVDYLCDSDLQKMVVDWISDEAGIKQKALIRPCVRLVAWLLVKTAKSAGKWVVTEAGGRFQRKLMESSCFRMVTEYLLKLKSKIDSKTADKVLIDEIISGKRPPHDAEFGNVLSQDLQVTLKMWEELESGIEEIISLLKPQPKLDLQLLERTESNRLNYRVGRVPFLGREAELVQLEEFLCSQPGFSWWIVTGPGGMGKSRLGMELCLRNGGAWRVGFLPSDHGFTNWQNWQPDQPTLMLIDYAAGRPGELHSLISSLSGRGAEFEYPVRCLLLERDTSEYWWDKFIGSGTTEGYKIEAVMHEKGSLQLGPLSVENTWKTIEIILQESKTPLPDKAETLESLGKIDPEFKPLYTALAAESIAAGEDIRHWDKSKLLDDLLKREEREFWTGATDRDKNLLALATMVGGLECDTLESLDSDLLPSLKSGADNCFNQDLYERMAGHKMDGSKIPPLEPDPVGEYFVLRFAESDDVIKRGAIDGLREYAWICNPHYYAKFLIRLGRDFPQYDTVLKLAEFDENEQAQLYFGAKIVLYLLAVRGQLMDLRVAKKLHDRLELLLDKHQDETELSLTWAQGTFNLITYYAYVEEVESAQRLHFRFESLVRRYTDDQEIRLLCASSTVNLMNMFCRLKNEGVASQLYDQLETLSQRHPDEPGLRLTRAQGLFNLITAYGSSGSLESARELLDRLHVLSQEHSEEKGLSYFSAVGFGRFSYYCAKSGDMVHAREYCLMFKYLMGQIPSDGEAYSIAREIKSDLEKLGVDTE